MKRWNRLKMMRTNPRRLDYDIIEQKEVTPHVELKKWDWVSQQILKAKTFWKAWKWLIDNFYDVDFVVTGRKGSGKTSVGLKICVIHSDMYEVEFTVKDDVVTGRIVILTPELIADTLLPYKMKFIDEIQHPFNRMRASSTANIEANRFMDLKRKWRVNIGGTMPQITSAESYLINEKFVFWINCWKNLKRKRMVKTVVWVNLVSKDGKYRDWVRLEERDFEYCDTRLYNSATRKWKKEHADVRNLEDFKKRQADIADRELKRQRAEKIRSVLSYHFLSFSEKCYVLLDPLLNLPNLRVESLLKSYLRKREKEEELSEDEEDIRINKNFVSEKVAEMDIDTSLLQRALEKIERHQEGEREII